MLEGASGSGSHCCSPEERLTVEPVEYVQKNKSYGVLFKLLLKFVEVLI